MDKTATISVLEKMTYGLYALTTTHEGKMRAMIASWVTGCPVLQQCIAYMECRVMETRKPGNHTLFISEVQHAVRLSAVDSPLSTLDYDGAYAGKE
ncbi:MAG: flavin reductase [Desulfatiglandaceae bacterium]